MTLYVHESNAAYMAVPPFQAQPWDRFCSAGPLVGSAPELAQCWQAVGAAEGNPANPMQFDENVNGQAWVAANANAGAYNTGYPVDHYAGGFGGYSGTYAGMASVSQLGNFGPQNSYILNMDQYSDASDSEDEPSRKEPPSKAPSPRAARLLQEDVKEPAPEPVLGGGRTSELSSLSAEFVPSWLPMDNFGISAVQVANPFSPCGALQAVDVESTASEPEAEATFSEQAPDSPQLQPWRAPSRSLSGLKVSQGSWAAQQRARRDSGAEEDAEVERRLKSILNKLTIEKFPVLYKKLLASGIHTAGHAEALIREVFEKATTQHHFVPMYADLCAMLQEHFEKNPVTDDNDFSFRRLLLNECQVSFERNLAPPAELESLDKEERTLVEFQYKTRMLGNIRFVGALLTRKMLASKVMFAIVEELLALSTPEALESLAVLLTAVGSTFDRPEWAYHDMLQHVFTQVKTLTSKASCNARARCLLKDLLDLRERGWKDTRPKRCEGPTTLQGVAKQAAAEERAAAIAAAGLRTPGQRNRGR